MSGSVYDSDEDGPTNITNPVVARAHRRFLRCQRWEAVARSRWLDDLKFANGDAYNNYQWPSDIYNGRGNRPSLTVNETQQHNLHIINESKQNKSGVKYRPVGDGASPDAAEVLEGIYRHISNISNAQMSQGVAIEFQVNAGLGFTVIQADYMDQNTFDQEIYIRPVPDPMAVYLDCDAREADGSDARYGFVFADCPRDEIEEKYPRFKGRGVPTNAVDENFGWIRDDHIREADYYEVTEDKDELIANDTGLVGYKSEIPPALLKQWEAEEKDEGGQKLKRRPIIRKKLKLYKIIGDELVDESDLPGTGIPIVPWNGTVTIIEGELDRKSHTRTMISAQQMINYNWSASVEFGALQSKTPYMAAIEAIEGNETYWWSANTDNPAVLPYKAFDDQGRPMPPPQRQEPPQSAPVFMEGVQMGRQFMLSASGQYEAEMGAPGNERSGRAINERQRQGDRATYHFIDNQAIAERRQGQIVQEWIPVIYDTERALRIIGEDGTESLVQIDPAAKEAHQASEVKAISGIFNPNIGKYEVISDVGPDYATERQEAFNAIMQILTAAPELVTKIGDLLFLSGDFPNADKIAERLKPGLPPEYQAELSRMQEQAANQHRLLQETMQALTEERLKVKSKDSDNTIDAFKADTDRLTALKDFLGLDPKGLKQLVKDAIEEARQDNLGPVVGDLMHADAIDTSVSGPPGAAGALPVRVPDVGQQISQPGGA